MNPSSQLVRVSGPRRRPRGGKVDLGSCGVEPGTWERGPGTTSLGGWVPPVSSVLRSKREAGETSSRSSMATSWRVCERSLTVPTSWVTGRTDGGVGVGVPRREDEVRSGRTRVRRSCGKRGSGDITDGWVYTETESTHRSLPDRQE